MNKHTLVSNLFFFAKSGFFSILENLNFYFTKTATIPVYGNVALYGIIALSVSLKYIIVSVYYYDLNFKLITTYYYDVYFIS